MFTAEFKYALGVALFASIGTFVFGFDTGIATTTIAHDSWKVYMDHPSHSVTGGVVSVFIGGEALGSLTMFLVGDYLGRIRFLQLMCIIVTVGTAVQTGAVNVAMFLAGRGIAGIGIGGMVSAVPLYLIEISAPSYRGFISSISGCGMTFGIMTSNWVGFACSFAPYGHVQWRLPLGLQIPWGIFLFIGLSTFMPNSPRMLILQGKPDAAHAEFIKIRKDLSSDEVVHEFDLMKAQIQYEKDREIRSYKEVFMRYRRRALIAISIQIMVSLTGVNVIQYNQTSIYKNLGLGPTTILAMAGVYGTISFVANYIATHFLMDQWGRRKLLIGGMIGVCMTEIYTAEMTRKFQTSSSRVGQGFTVLGIFLFDVVYYTFLGSTIWIYPPEIIPTELRNKVVAAATFLHFVINVAITEAAPTAFANIGENYYYVFVGCTAIFSVVGYFYYPETKQKTLEEIAGEFGDEIVAIPEKEKGSEVLPKSSQVEAA